MWVSEKAVSVYEYAWERVWVAFLKHKNEYTPWMHIGLLTLCLPIIQRVKYKSEKAVSVCVWVCEGERAWILPLWNLARQIKQICCSLLRERVLQKKLWCSFFFLDRQKEKKYILKVPKQMAQQSKCY